MTYNAEAAAIAAIIGAVPDSGIVFDHQPLPKGNTWAEFVKSFTTTIDGKRHVRAWTVQLIRDERIPKTISQAAVKIERRTTWRLRYHLSWDGASELGFRDQVVAVMTAVDTNRSLGGTVLDHDPCDLDIPNDGAGVILGDVLCHYAELDFVAYAETTLNNTL